MRPPIVLTDEQRTLIEARLRHGGYGDAAHVLAAGNSLEDALGYMPRDGLAVLLAAESNENGSLWSYLDLSTEHLPVRGDRRLDPSTVATSVIADAYPYGWWLHVPADDDDLDRASSADSDSQDAATIIAIWRYARKLGAVFVRLDADGAIVAGLPRWDDDGSPYGKSEQSAV